MVKIRLTVFLLLLAVPSLFSLVPVQELSKRIGASLQWDPILENVILSRGTDQLMLIPDTPFFLMNFQQKIAVDPPQRTGDGQILLTESAVETISAMYSRPPETPDSEGLLISAIIIDAGHGGKDSGAIGEVTVNGASQSLKEKDLVLKTALGVQRRLNQTFPDRQILMTRDDDTYLALEERTDIANGKAEDLTDNEAILFVSIHANGSMNSRASGIEVWYLPPEYDRILLDPDSLDEVERGSYHVLNTLLDEEISAESEMLAEKILEGMAAQVGDRSPNRGIKKEKWAVVRNARMPSVLVEIGFVTNKQEAANLNNPGYLQKIIDGIYNGITGFIREFEDSKGFTE